ncbi:hypothetical protein C7475_1021061 [Chitinophaga sp. S165]|nr:hypothetical protein C7475_1021061 [Chitinophaga sp. S165]
MAIVKDNILMQLTYSVTPSFLMFYHTYPPGFQLDPLSPQVMR